MPGLDAEIPMGGVTPDTHLANPLTMINDMAGLQKTMVDLQTTRMTLAAKEKAGQIMALAPNLDAGIAAMHQDPNVAGFVPDIIATMQSIAASEQQVSASKTTQAGEIQTQNISGLHSVMGGLLGAINNPDPKYFDALIAANRVGLSPSAQATVDAAMPSIKASLFQGLSTTDPALAVEQYQQRFAAMLVGAGYDPNTVRASVGTMAPQLVQTTGPGGESITSLVGGPMTGQANPTQVISVGPTTAKAAQMTAEGTLAGSITADMSDASAVLPASLATIDNAISLLNAYPDITGGGSDVFMNFAKTAQGFQKVFGKDAITDEMINKIAGGDTDKPGALAAQETLTANLRNFVTNQLKIATAGVGSGRIKSEVDAYLQSADITTDRVSLLQLLNQAKQVLAIDAEKAKAYPQFLKDLKDPNSKAALYGPAGYYTYFNNEILNLKNVQNPPGGGIPLVNPNPGDVTLTPPSPDSATPDAAAKKAAKDKLLQDLLNQ